MERKSMVDFVRPAFGCLCPIYVLNWVWVRSFFIPPVAVLSKSCAPCVDGPLSRQRRWILLDTAAEGGEWRGRCMTDDNNHTLTFTYLYSLTHLTHPRRVVDVSMCVCACGTSCACARAARAGLVGELPHTTAGPRALRSAPGNLTQFLSASRCKSPTSFFTEDYRHCSHYNK
eukprot:scaffold7453_cov128-Isochrysis_galbana.AAC.4